MKEENGGQGKERRVLYPLVQTMSEQGGTLDKVLVHFAFNPASLEN